MFTPVTHLTDVYQLARIRIASDNLALPEVIGPLAELHAHEKDTIDEELRKLQQERMALNTYVREREPRDRKSVV